MGEPRVHLAHTPRDDNWAVVLTPLSITQEYEVLASREF